MQKRIKTIIGSLLIASLVLTTQAPMAHATESQLLEDYGAVKIDCRTGNEEAVRENTELYVPKEDVETAMEIDPGMDTLGESVIDGEEYIKIDSESSAEIRDTIPGAKKSGKVKLFSGGHTNDIYNNTSDSPQIYNNGFFTLHQHGATGSGVEIAVIDSFILPNAPEIEDNIDWDNAYDAVKKKKLEKTDVPDDHSTAITSLLVEKQNDGQGIAGIAPKAKILPIKAFDGEEAGLEIIYNALDYLHKKIEAGELNELRVVNMSLGIIDDDEAFYDCQDVGLYYDEYPFAKEIQEEINYLHSKGITIVCAAGNEAEEIVLYDDGRPYDFMGDNVAFPADCKNVVSVACVDKNNTLSSFSNCRKATDLVAVGEDVTALDADEEYSVYGGTSISAPVVSAAFALLYSLNPDLTEEEILPALKSTGTSMKKDIADEERRKSDYAGKTVMNVTRAYNKLFGTNFKIDVKYAFMGKTGALEDWYTSVPYNKSTFMSDWLHGGACIYGLKWKDIPYGEFRRKITKNRIYYAVKIKGPGYVTRTHTYSLKRTPDPQVSTKRNKNKVIVTYKKHINDSILIKIYRNGKLYKTKKIEVDGGFNKNKTVKKKITFKLPKGNYTFKFSNYEHLYRASTEERDLYYNYKGIWHRTKKIRIP